MKNYTSNFLQAARATAMGGWGFMATNVCYVERELYIYSSISGTHFVFIKNKMNVIKINIALI